MIQLKMMNNRTEILYIYFVLFEKMHNYKSFEENIPKTSVL